jgi:hypothetical protein
MSYDLYGTWDSDNPIGSQVLAHSNLTEIDLALDLVSFLTSILPMSYYLPFLFLVLASWS